MEELIRLMRIRLNEIKNTMKKAEKEKDSYPEGTLRISVSKGKVRYYHVLGRENPKGQYVSKKNIKLIQGLAQKAYSKEFLKKAENEYRNLEKAIRRLEESNVEQAYQKLNPERQKLVVPHILTDDLYARQWQSLHFKQNPYKPENKIYETKRGEIVRSKSEALIADILFDLRIPYHYEMPLKLGKGIIRYPDFTILKKKTREVYYFEHFGMMDNDEYRSKCFDKIDEYRKNGIYSGKNLIVTFETENIHLDIKGIREMLRDFCY